MAKMVEIKLGDGIAFDVEYGSPIHKKVMQAEELALETQMAVFVTSAGEKLMLGIKALFSELDENEQLALSKKAFVARFNGKSVVEDGIHQAHKVKVYERNPKNMVG